MTSLEDIPHNKYTRRISVALWVITSHFPYDVSFDILNIQQKQHQLKILLIKYNINSTNNFGSEIKKNNTCVYHKTRCLCDTSTRFPGPGYTGT